MGSVELAVCRRDQNLLSLVQLAGRERRHLLGRWKVVRTSTPIYVREAYTELKWSDIEAKQPKIFRA